MVRMILCVALASCAVATMPAAVEAAAPRQYYSNWRAHPRKAYHYRVYYYKPKPDYSGYRHHYVIHHPRYPRYHYFYNPYKKRYWGRCPVQTGGRSLYSRLPDNLQRQSLADIPDTAFPAPGPAPAIPESTDGIPLDLPPDDLPPDLSGVPEGG